MKPKVFTQEEILTDIESVVREIFNRAEGTNYFEIGIINEIKELPQYISKLNVWYIPELDSLNKILTILNTSFGLELDANSTGLYLFVYENQSQ